MFRLPTITLPTLLLIPLATVTGLLHVSTARATILYVDASCGDDAKAGTSPNCADANGPKLTIQNAINTAVDTDEVVVELGIYNEVIDFLGKAITLRSTDPSDPAVVAATIIDGTGLNNSVVTCTSGEGPDTVLDGFTITGGNGHTCPAPIEDYTCGGGMYNRSNSRPTVSNCTFGRNTAHFGGGMNNRNSSPAVTNCTFSANTATFNGGGMYNYDNSSPTVTNCTFSWNTASYGGGTKNYYSSPTVTNCTFSGNTSDLGGGMDNWASNPTVTNCTFTGNTSYVGGGMYNHDNSGPMVSNCTFSGNTATSTGGGMHNYYYGSPTVINCTFAGNRANDGGGGMYSREFSSPTLTNSILWGDLPDEILNYDTGMHNPIVSYSDVHGGLPPGTIDGGGNIDVDPLFIRNSNNGADAWGDDPDTTEIDEGANDDFGDLRLQSGSLCRDEGDPDFIPEPGETDLDGHVRVLCGRVDMGAYEFGIGDYDCNDAVDLLDFSTWEACMTGPDAGPYAEGCEAFDFDGDTDVDMTDFALFVAGFEGS